MVIAKPKGKYTYADYAATPEGERWELIDGVLYHMAAAPNTKHQESSENTGNLINDVVRPGTCGAGVPRSICFEIVGHQHGGAGSCCTSARPGGTS